MVNSSPKKLNSLRKYKSGGSGSDDPQEQAAAEQVQSVKITQQNVIDLCKNNPEEWISKAIDEGLTVAKWDKELEKLQAGDYVVRVKGDGKFSIFEVPAPAPAAEE